MGKINLPFLGGWNDCELTTRAEMFMTKCRYICTTSPDDEHFYDVYEWVNGNFYAVYDGRECKMTIREAAQKWVCEFNRVPQNVLKRLDDFKEITLPLVGDRVRTFEAALIVGEGEIVALAEDDYPETKDRYIVDFGGEGGTCTVSRDFLEVMRETALPMWAAMWSFGESLDNEWIKDGRGLEALTLCRFRVYEQEDYGYVFGIDGAGYDFYESHWIPLYKERGLHWHDERGVVNAVQE